MPALISLYDQTRLSAVMTSSTTGELHQRPVAHKLDDPSCMGSNHRINEPAPQCIQTGNGPGLVQTNEARVPDHVC